MLSGVRAKVTGSFLTRTLLAPLLFSLENGEGGALPKVSKGWEGVFVSDAYPPRVFSCDMGKSIRF